jgi:hypothetical protein
VNENEQGDNEGDCETETQSAEHDFLLPSRVSAASGSEQVYVSRRAQVATLATARGTDFSIVDELKPATGA